MKRRRNGFTLIELFVVIAIIAILAAILFPVFQKVSESDLMPGPAEPASVDNLSSGGFVATFYPH